jgi:hypothetical protein
MLSSVRAGQGLDFTWGTDVNKGFFVCLYSPAEVDDSWYADPLSSDSNQFSVNKVPEPGNQGGEGGSNCVAL